MTNTELKHYGVVGMKWGRRKGTIKSIQKYSVAKLKKVAKAAKQPVKTIQDKLSLMQKKTGLYDALDDGNDHQQHIFNEQVDMQNSIFAQQELYNIMDIGMF